MLIKQTISNQLTFHLAKFLPDLPSPCSTRTPLLNLVLGKLPMTEISSRDSCTPALGSWYGAFAAMKMASTDLWIADAVAGFTGAGFC